MKIKNSIRFRLLVVISVIYVALVSTTYNLDFNKFIWLVSPIWVFWSSVWIWSSTFENFFGVSEQAKKNKELNEWVYWDTERAKKHKYYGIKGWALLLAIGIGFSIIGSVFIEVFNAVLEIDDALVEKYPDYKQVLIFSNIQYWVSVVLSLIVLYLLISHKESFQKSYVIVYIFSLITDTLLLLATEIKFDDAIYIILQTAIYLIAGFIWLIYVLKSKRINLTTRKRIKKKYENSTFF
jgi:hypothetical protein